MEKALQAQTVQAQLIGSGLGACGAADAAGERGGQVFLDSHLLPTRIRSQIHDTEAAHCEVAHNPVSLHKRAGRERCGLVHDGDGVPKRKGGRESKVFSALNTLWGRKTTCQFTV
jgi:hypothetical protein